MTSPSLVNGGHISPTGVPASYVVVWEWENRPTWWRPYSPEVTQLLERAHNKKLNRIYLKDADPLLQEYYINMTNFEQVFEPTGATYAVRREFYPHNCPAGKGSKWEWCVGDINKPSDPNNASNWHMYDMEVQAVIEESWTKGEQTIDIGKHFPGCPYIINFCNMTQVRSKTGQVRRVRRLPQPSYPMVRLTQAEIAAMLHRKEERIRERAEELERIKKEHAQRNGSAKKKGKKKAVKHLMSQIFHMPHSHNSQNHQNGKDDKIKTSPNAHNPLLSNNTSPNDSQSHRKVLSASTHNVRSTIANLTDSNRSRQLSNNTSPPRRSIGHPSSMSEYGFPTIIGRRGQINRGPASVIGGYRNGNSSYRYHQSQSDTTGTRGHGNPHQTGYRRFQDYSSFSSFSDTSSIVRRPSMDTISTYLSNQEQYQNGYGNYGGSSRSFYGGSFSCSQEMIDVYGNQEGDSDSVFTDEDVSLNLSNATTNCNSLNSSAVRRLTYHQTNNLSNGHKRYGSIGGSIAEVETNQVNHYGGARPKIREAPDNPLRLNQINGSNHSMYPSTLNSRNRVFSDPEISNIGQYHSQPHPNSLYNRDVEEDSNLYVNQCQLENDLNNENNRYEDPEDNIYCNVNTPPFGQSPVRAQNHKRQNSNISNNTLTKENNTLALSQHSLNGIGKCELMYQHKHGFSSVQSSPLRGATIRDYPLGYNTNDSLSSSTKSLSKKRPVPTPRTILNVATSIEQINAENEENQIEENRSFTNGKLENISNIQTDSEIGIMSELDKIILRYSQIVIDPNQPDDYCPVCVRHLNESSPPTNDTNDGTSNFIKEKDNSSVICLTNCQHKVHVACLKRSTLNNQKNGFSKLGYICCPTCKSVCGHIEGDMPSKGATMTYRIIAKGLPGYEDYHTIQVTYNFPDNCALQGPEHPNPGKPLLFVGFPKTAFLPDTEKGRRVLRMLEVAFHKRLTFTVEPSGEVVWNETELPHKTEFGPPKQKVFGSDSTSPTSYPDMEYLDNIIQKLGRLGISDEAAV